MYIYHKAMYSPGQSSSSKEGPTYAIQARQKKDWKNKKQRYRVTNWREYNAALIQRGAIDVWICDDIKTK